MDKAERQRINQLKTAFIDQIPLEKEHGVLYISMKCELSIHLCACGCGIPTVLPFSCIIDGKDIGWVHSFNGDLVTTKPSIGNFSWDRPSYHAHYYITDNRIVWC